MGGSVEIPKHRSRAGIGTVIGGRPRNDETRRRRKSRVAAANAILRRGRAGAGSPGPGKTGRADQPLLGGFHIELFEGDLVRTDFLDP